MRKDPGAPVDSPAFSPLPARSQSLIADSPCTLLSPWFLFAASPTLLLRVAARVARSRVSPICHMISCSFASRPTRVLFFSFSLFTFPSLFVSKSTRPSAMSGSQLARRTRALDGGDGRPTRALYGRYGRGWFWYSLPTMFPRRSLFVTVLTFANIRTGPCHLKWCTVPSLQPTAGAVCCCSICLLC